MASKIFYLLTTTVASVWCANTFSDCKCTPSENCWPSPSEWSVLNDTVQGRLINAVLPASVCYPEEPNYNADACEQILLSWTSSKFHAADPISVDDPANANNSCNPIYANGTSLTGDPGAGKRGCQRGYYPLYVINATDATHVQAGVKFAQKHNIRLNVKNTGHGRSATANSISIWTHYMKEIRFLNNYLPQSPYGNNTTEQMGVTLGAGAQDRDVFEAAAAHNVVVVGGTDSTVGIVGWLTGGGHGYLTATYGMGADNLLQAAIVTPLGEVLTANEFQNSDIFWAIRGGGGGTFGVITEITVKAYPMPTTTTWTLVMDPVNGSSPAKVWDLVAYINSELPRLKDGGLQGYYTAAGVPLKFTNIMFGHDLPNGTVEALVAPILAHLEAENETVTVTSSVYWLPRWIDSYHEFNLTLPAGAGGGISGSRLIPARALTEDLDFLARTLEKIGPKANETSSPIKHLGLYGSVVGNSYHYDNALNPAWRDAVVHLIAKESWSDGIYTEEKQAAVDDMTYEKGYALRQLAPDSGAYFNEANLNEPNWQWTLFGSNYPRLQAIKRKYDPYGLQWCYRCVGSEDWVQADDGRLCRQSWV